MNNISSPFSSGPSTPFKERDCSVVSIINGNAMSPWLAVPCDWRRPAAGSGYQLFWSEDEGFGQVVPRPKPEEIAGFYDVEYYTHTALSKGKEVAPPRFLSLVWKIIHHLAWRRDEGVDPDRAWWLNCLGSESRRVLEIGCGSGTNLEILNSLGHQVQGVEPDKSAVPIARERGFEVHSGTAEDLPEVISRQRFNGILMIHVLEHCLDPVLALKNSIELLSEGGLLVIEVPNQECLGARLQGPSWHWLDVPRHLNFFTTRSLELLARKNDLVVKEIRYRGYCRQFAPEWVEVERHISEVFSGMGVGTLRSHTRQLIFYAYHVIRTMYSKDKVKYDSVRMVLMRR